MTRWDDTSAPRGDAYDQRWAHLSESGESVHGEADLVESLLLDSGGRRVLDAGCGTGRVAVELHRRGYRVDGVDADDTMLASARRKSDEIGWVTADLATLDEHLETAYDVVVLAGNVMIFLTPGSEARVIAQCARRLRPGGLLISGFSLGARRLHLADYDAFAAAAGLAPIARFSTWERAPYAGGDYAVSVHRREPSDSRE